MKQILNITIYKYYYNIFILFLQVSKSTIKPKNTVHFPLFNHKPSSRPFNIGKGEKTPLNLPGSVSEVYFQLTPNDVKTNCDCEFIKIN